jgi:hypothetical protein
MVKIKSIWMDSACCDKETGMGIILDADLDNGACIMVCLDSKAGEPRFDDIMSGKCRDQPQTDSERVYWENESSLTLGEMMGMLQIGRETEAAT